MWTTVPVRAHCVIVIVHRDYHHRWMHEWMNESMNESINQSIKQSMNQWINEAMKPYKRIPLYVTHTERCRIRCSETEIESATNKHWLGAVTSRLRELHREGCSLVELSHRKNMQENHVRCSALIGSELERQRDRERATNTHWLGADTSGLWDAVSYYPFRCHSSQSR